MIRILFAELKSKARTLVVVWPCDLKVQQAHIKAKIISIINSMMALGLLVYIWRYKSLSNRTKWI